MLQYIIALFIIPIAANADLGYSRSQEFDINSNYWSPNMDENSTLSLGTTMGCNFCGDIFYHEPPPNDIMIMPPPPLYHSFEGSLSEIFNPANQQTNDQCNFCKIFDGEAEQDGNPYIHDNMNNPVVALLIAFLLISGISIVYLISTRGSKIFASMSRSIFYHNDQPTNGGNKQHKNSSLNESIANSGVHLSDPCYLQTNHDKNLTSPIISDHVPHKKTSIPSKCWAQPGSIIGKTIRRIPNEYEVPSSRTNSTGTSSAVYADMNNENNQRFFSPYNLHTYAEVREIFDPNERYHTSSNSSGMLSESNYDNAVYNHGNCALGNGAIVAAAPNGSVQMSDFNSMRPIQSMSYGQPSTMNHHILNHANAHHNNAQTMYEQPPQRAQIIITSNNQGVNPTLLNYKERIHNVI